MTLWPQLSTSSLVWCSVFHIHLYVIIPPLYILNADHCQAYVNIVLSVLRTQGTGCVVYVIHIVCLGVQETLSPWTCVQCTTSRPWCATLCLWWAMGFTVTCWRRASGTAGWARFDTTTQVSEEAVEEGRDTCGSASVLSPDRAASLSHRWAWPAWTWSGVDDKAHNGWTWPKCILTYIGYRLQSLVLSGLIQRQCWGTQRTCNKAPSWPNTTDKRPFEDKWSPFFTPLVGFIQFWFTSLLHSLSLSPSVCPQDVWCTCVTGAMKAQCSTSQLTLTSPAPGTKPAVSLGKGSATSFSLVTQ